MTVTIFTTSKSTIFDRLIFMMKRVYRVRGEIEKGKYPYSLDKQTYSCSTKLSHGACRSNESGSTVVILFISIEGSDDSRKRDSLFRIGTAKPISASIKCSERERVQRTSFSLSFVLSFYRPLSLSHVQSPPV